MATNLQEAARRMYSAKGFTDYGKILGAGLKQAVRDIAIARKQEEREAKAERKQRDAFALDLYAKRPSINEGAVPPEMLPIVKNWLLDTRNQYNEAVQNLSGDISDPSYRAAIDMANRVKTNYANLSSQMQMFKKNQKEYLETVATTGFSNSNNQTDINLVSAVYNKDFSNFTIDDNGKIVLETEQGIKTLDEVNELFESLNPKTPKQTQGISTITDRFRNIGMQGYDLTDSDMNDAAVLLGENFADRQNTLSYALDNPGVKEFISNSLKLEDGSFPDEKMHLSDPNNEEGVLDDEWIRNPENYDVVYDKVIEHGMDLIKRSNQDGKSRYNTRKAKEKGKDNLTSATNNISRLLKSFKAGRLGAFGDVYASAVPGGTDYWLDELEGEWMLNKQRGGTESNPELMTSYGSFKSSGTAEEKAENFDRLMTMLSAVDENISAAYTPELAEELAQSFTSDPTTLPSSETGGVIADGGAAEIIASGNEQKMTIATNQLDKIDNVIDTAINEHWKNKNWRGLYNKVNAYIIGEKGKLSEGIDMLNQWSIPDTVTEKERKSIEGEVEAQIQLGFSDMDFGRLGGMNKNKIKQILTYIEYRRRNKK